MLFGCQNQHNDRFWNCSLSYYSFIPHKTNKYETTILRWFVLEIYWILDYSICITTMPNRIKIVGVKRLFISGNLKDECTLGIPYKSIEFYIEFYYHFRSISFVFCKIGGLIEWFYINLWWTAWKWSLYKYFVVITKMLWMVTFCIIWDFKGTQYAIICFILFTGFWNSL